MEYSVVLAPYQPSVDPRALFRFIELAPADKHLQWLCFNLGGSSLHGRRRKESSTHQHAFPGVTRHLFYAFMGLKGE